MIEANTGKLPHRLEDLNPRALVAALNLPSSSVKYDAAALGPALEAVPTQMAVVASATPKGSRRQVLKWSELQAEIGPALSRRLWITATRYGYRNLKPPVSLRQGDGEKKIINH